MPARLLMLLPFAYLTDPCTPLPPPGDDDDDGAPCGAQECAAGECCVVSCGGDPAQDQCTVPPGACDAVWEPVCGCDGATYSSRCTAEAACVGVDFEGACEDAEPLCAGEPCDCCLRGCGGEDEGEQCISPGGSCTAQYDPVCGCDGRTYSNDCVAHRSCAAIATRGACGE